MKRIFSALLVLLLAFSLFSCSAAYPGDSNTGIDEVPEVIPSTDGDISQRKLIKTVKINMEALEYEKTLQAIDDACAEFGAYIQDSNERGTSYDSSSYRSASFTVRVPADKVDGFLDSMKKAGNITSSATTSQDVTKTYIDTQARLASLELQKTQYMAFLEEAKNTSEMIELTRALNDVIYEIEKLNSELKSYDSLIAYSTVTISVREVSRFSPDAKDSFFTRVGDTFNSSLKALGNLFEFLGLAIVAIVPFLILPAVIVVVIVLIVRAKKKKSKKDEDR